MKVKGYWEKFKNIFTKNEINILPGNLAFYFVMSIIPVVTITFYLLMSFNLSFDLISNFLEKNLSSSLANIVQPILNSGDTWSFFLTIGLSLILASNGADSIIIASNTVFSIENSPWLKRRIKSIVLIVILVLLFSFVLIVPLLGSTILTLFAKFGLVVNSNARAYKIVYTIMQIPVSFIVIYFFIKIIYTIAPDETIQSKSVTKGAVFTSIMWLLVTSGYSYYINNIASYDKFYGGLATFIILLLWFYILAYIFVIGLVLNHDNVEENIEKTNSQKFEQLRDKINQNNKSKE